MPFKALRNGEPLISLDLLAPTWRDEERDRSPAATAWPIQGGIPHKTLRGIGIHTGLFSRRTHTILSSRLGERENG